MKKVLCVLLCATIMLGLAGCIKIGQVKRCEECDEEIKSGWNNCPNCGAQIDTSDIASVVDDTNKVEEYINESNALLNEGKLKAALLVLYDCVDTLGESEKIKKAIDDYFVRVTLVSDANPDQCGAEYCFRDTTHSEYSTGCKDGDLGLTLVDSQTGARETIARITLQYEVDYYPPKENDLTIVGNRDDSWLFYTFCGPGKRSSFLYNIHTNKLSTFENAPGSWQFAEDVLISTTISFAVGDDVTLYAYDWDANLLYQKENILSGVNVKDGWVYFAKATEAGDKRIYDIFKMKADGTEEQKICFIEATQSSYLYINGDNIEWYDNGKNNKMSLYDAYSVTL